MISFYHGSDDDIQSCNVFTQSIDSLDETSKQSFSFFFIISRSFASKYHISKIIYPDGQTVYLPEPFYDLSDVENVYRSSSWYRQQRTMLHLTSELLHNASIPLLLSNGWVEYPSSFVEDLAAAVFLGVPFPWTDTIQGYILHHYVSLIP